MQSFWDLQVWQKSHAMTLEVYKDTGLYPASEKFGLTSQSRGAAASIGTNIAEGCGRGSGADFARFLQMAMGSASELQYSLLLARDLGFLSGQRYDALAGQLTEIKRMVTGLISKVKGK